MNIINKYIFLLSFICTFTICYNILLCFFSFNYVKVNNIKIENKSNFKEETKFIAELDNGFTCYIDVKNSVMIDNIISKMNNKHIKYYTLIYNNSTSTEINYEEKINCSKPMDNLEILLYYVSFYLCILVFTFGIMLIGFSTLITFFALTELVCENKLEDNYSAIDISEQV